jgi:ribosomal protein L18E
MQQGDVNPHPTNAELGELVSLLQEFAADQQQAGWKTDADKLTRAAELIQAMASRPLLVEAQP